MKRIAYICADPGVPVFGRKGCSVHVQEVIRALRREGCEVELFARNCKGEAPVDLADVRVHTLPIVDQGDSIQREQSLLAGNEIVSRLLGEAAPFDLVYERYSLWSHAAMEWAAARGIPGLLEVNAPLIQEQSRYRQLHDEAGTEKSTRCACGAAAAVLAVSSEVAAYLQQFKSAEQIEVVSNGVDVGRFGEHVTSQLVPAPGLITVGFVGTLKPWHGVDMLIEAASVLEGIRLLIVGDGPERSKLERLALMRGYSDHTAVFTGAIDPDCIPAYLASMDVAAAPYPRLEEFYFSPLKIFEYMAAGCAIVASDVGQISETLVHERNALLCAPGDLTALTAALKTLRDDSDLRQRLGQNARMEALRDHSWDGVALRILAIAKNANRCVQETCR